MPDPSITGPERHRVSLVVTWTLPRDDDASRHFEASVQAIRAQVIAAVPEPAESVTAYVGELPPSIAPQKPETEEPA